MCIPNEWSSPENGYLGEDNLQGVIGIPVENYNGYIAPVRLQLWVVPQNYTDDMMVQLTVPKKWRCEVNAEWKQTDPNLVLSQFGRPIEFQSWYYRFKVTAYSNVFVNLPDVRVLAPPQTRTIWISPFAQYRPLVKGCLEKRLISLRFLCP